MSLFTIKKKHAGGTVRVFLPRIDIKLQIGDVALVYSSPKYLREYWFESYQNP